MNKGICVSIRKTRRSAFPTVALLMLLTLCNTLRATTITARSCSLADVSTAVAAAASGDTVAIPAGSATWAGTVTINKGISVIGAGPGKTIISRSSVGQLFIIDGTTATQPPRLSGMTLATSSTYSDGGAWVKVNGKSHGFRVDHIKFDIIPAPTSPVSTSTLEAGGDKEAWGVIDHCYWSKWISGETLFAEANSWGGVGSWGDNSWTDDPYWALDKAVYVEDCIYDGTWYWTDETLAGGGRMVVRYCTSKAMTGNHGSDTSNRIRSGRMMEYYNTKFDFPTQQDTATYTRGGSVTFFNNRATNVVMEHNTWETLLWRVASNPDFPYGGADGINPFDLNATGPVTNHLGNTVNPLPSPNTDQGIYQQGTYSGPNTTSYTGNWYSITLPGLPSTQTNEWKGFTVRNITAWQRFLTYPGKSSDLNDKYGGNPNRTWYCYVVHSEPATGGGTTISWLPPDWGVPQKWLTGDKYEVRKVDRAFDNIGNGKGDLLSGGLYNPINTTNNLPTYIESGVPGGAPSSAWPHQIIDGAYQWGNSRRASSTDTFQIFNWDETNAMSDVALLGRDRFNAIRPNYPETTVSSTDYRLRIGADDEAYAIAGRASDAFKPGDPNAATRVWGFPYPHPLVSGSGAPAAPSNLRIVPGG